MSDIFSDNANILREIWSGVGGGANKFFDVG
jgi:hypothetical protein